MTSEVPLLPNFSSKHPIKYPLRLALPFLLIFLFLVGHIHICLKIHLLQPHRLGLFDELPSQVHNQHDWQLDVEAYETHTVEFRTEAAPALHEDNYAVENYADPRTRGICPVAKWEEVGFALSSEC